MKNVFESLGVGLADVGKWIAGASKEIAGIATKVKAVLQAEKPLEQEFVEGVSEFVADVEAFASVASGAATAQGLNFPADSAAYNALVKVIADAKALVPVVEKAISVAKSA